MKDGVLLINAACLYLISYQMDSSGWRPLSLAESELWGNWGFHSIYCWQFSAHPEMVICAIFHTQWRGLPGCCYYRHWQINSHIH